MVKLYLAHVCEMLSPKLICSLSLTLSLSLSLWGTTGCIWNYKRINDLTIVKLDAKADQARCFNEQSADHILIFYSCFCFYFFQRTLRKHTYTNILKISQPKTESFQIKILIFFFFIFLLKAEIRKIMYTPVNPSVFV